MTALMFFHGLESGPHGRKSQALRQAFGAAEAPDFRGMDLEERLRHAEALTRDLTDLVIVGSSFGGLVAALLAERHPARVEGLVLCAPALHREEAEALTGLPERAVIIHGVQDEVVPFEASRAFCERHGVELRAVEDGHRLQGSTQEIIEATAALLSAPGSPGPSASRPDRA